ncbi:MAG TPA: hypothetical protein VHX88_09030 [Solirubrobacteraceae bacterium]|jgi:hypothetical protein|nr:hypothetical protein [Solirubrobacteraceae bacterium]
MHASERWPGLGRWRWRVSGAWQWPTFALLVVGELVMLPALPPWGEQFGFISAFVIVGALNLVIVAAVGPLAGAVLRRRRRDLPTIIAQDRASAMLIGALFLAFLGLGIAHEGQIDRQAAEYDAQSNAVRAYVAAHGAAVYRRNIDRANSWQVDPHLYRTCVPSQDPGRDLCLFVDTSHAPPTLRIDSSDTPNAQEMQSFDRGG